MLEFVECRPKGIAGKENTMNVHVVMLRNTLPALHRILLKEQYYQNGWSREKTTFIFEPSDPASNDAHLENLQRLRDAGEEVVVVLTPDPLPAKAMHAGFPHIVMDPRGVIMRIVSVTPRLEIFNPGPPAA